MLDLVPMIGGVHGKYQHIPARLGESRHTQANIDKLKSFGWTPRVDLKEWLKRMATLQRSYGITD